MQFVPELRVRRDDLGSCEIFDDVSPREDLAEGEARLLVERFALSTNNVTYAVLGEELGYWRMFPGARRAPRARRPTASPTCSATGPLRRSD